MTWHKSPARSSPARRSGGCAVPPRGFSRGGAFTLFEILLAIVLLTLLVGVITVNMFDNLERRYLEEGAWQLETVVRQARADAAQKGRRLRMTFDAETGQARMQWEPQPLAQPGEFMAYGEPAWAKTMPNHLVRVTRCTPTGASALQTTIYGSGADEMAADDNAITSINFFPDGYTDSVIIELASKSEDDPRTAVIVVDGVNYQITTHVLTSSELVTFYEEKGLTADQGRAF